MYTPGAWNILYDGQGCLKMDDGVYSNQFSDKKCRNCGRIGCEGGASCEIASEMRIG